MSFEWCLLDVDGVLLNWTDGIRRFANDNYGIVPVADKNTDWDFSKWLGIPREDAVRISAEFFLSEAFSKLIPIEGAVEAVKLLKTKYRLAVVTSCSLDSNVVSFRKKNLNDVFGDVFEKIIPVPWQESKYNYLKQFDDVQLFIDDKPQNIEDGIKAGHKCILFEQAHSKGYKIPEEHSEKYVSLKNWNEILSYIENMNL